mgnify:FL=1
MNSEFGQEKMAEAIAEAIISYKNEYFGSQSNTTTPKKISGNESKDSVILKKGEAVAKNKIIGKEVTKASSSEVVFKVQLAVGKRKIKLKPANFKG